MSQPIFNPNAATQQPQTVPAPIPAGIPALINPVKLPEHVNAGTVAIEQSRAIAEAIGKIQAAKNFPRSMSEVYDKIKDSCSNAAVAKFAMYAYPRSGATVSGSSIRLAEIIARCYGNILYGVRELSQHSGISEMQAFAWDLEANVEKTLNFTVKHIRSSKTGITQLTDPRDVYEVTANQGSRRVRSCILAVVGKELEEYAVEICKKTMAGDVNKPIAERVREMVEAFKSLGITQQSLERRLGGRLDNILPDQMVEMRGIYNSIRDGMTTASDWFVVSSAHEPPAGTVADNINKSFNQNNPNQKL